MSLFADTKRRMPPRALLAGKRSAPGVSLLPTPPSCMAKPRGPPGSQRAKVLRCLAPDRSNCCESRRPHARAPCRPLPEEAGTKKGRPPLGQGVGQGPLASERFRVARLRRRVLIRAPSGPRTWCTPVWPPWPLPRFQPLSAQAVAGKVVALAPLAARLCSGLVPGRMVGTPLPAKLRVLHLAASW